MSPMQTNALCIWLLGAVSELVTAQLVQSLDKKQGENSVGLCTLSPLMSSIDFINIQTAACFTTPKKSSTSVQEQQLYRTVSNTGKYLSNID